MEIVVFTGAGISAESGIKTFRDSGGLWEEHSIYDVATPEAWEKDPQLVLRFYNDRRKQMESVIPNTAHKELVELERSHNVSIITQNVDDLHERAGSSNVLHLHGELKMARSTGDESLLYDYTGKSIEFGENCEKGYQLRPHVVWFAEMVPNLVLAENIASKADVFIVVGSSLQVYPAAGLIHATPPHCRYFYIDPKAEPINGIANLNIIKEKASTGVPKLAFELAKL